MNILEVECPLKIEAKTSRYNDKTNVIYSVAELQHNFCIDKKEIIKLCCNSATEYITFVLLLYLDVLASIFNGNPLLKCSLFQITKRTYTLIYFIF